MPTIKVNEFKDLVRSLPPPLVSMPFIVTYPDNPSQLPIDIYNHAYIKGPPVQRYVPQLVAVSKHVPLRSDSKLLQPIADPRTNFDMINTMLHHMNLHKPHQHDREESPLSGLKIFSEKINNRQTQIEQHGNRDWWGDFNTNQSSWEEQYPTTTWSSGSDGWGSSPYCGYPALADDKMEIRVRPVPSKAPW